ncbi:DUF4268 domain-containing protein [Lacunimicrobium album]
MTTPSLGRLEKVDLRTTWLSESSSFTPWLAQDTNIALLSDTIGIDLEVEAQEKNVGPFRADILCKDLATETWVLIENQLERTDHSHLGQLITYASGLEAVTIVWIAARFTDEHRAALDWLNNHTTEGLNFFGLEVELWRIGNSLAAPKFNVVSSPNDWTAQVSKGVRSVEITSQSPARDLQYRFWSGFHDYCKNNQCLFRPTKPQRQHWMALAIGRSGFNISAVASLSTSQKNSVGPNELRAELVVLNENSQAFFSLLRASEADIQSQSINQLIWHREDGVRMCRIYYVCDANLAEETNWLSYFEWLRIHLNDIHLIFSGRVKSLLLDDENE